MHVETKTKEIALVKKLLGGFLTVSPTDVTFNGRRDIQIRVGRISPGSLELLGIQPILKGPYDADGGLPCFIIVSSSDGVPLVARVLSSHIMKETRSLGEQRWKARLLRGVDVLVAEGQIQKK